MTNGQGLTLLRPTYGAVDLSALKFNLLKAKFIISTRYTVHQPKIMLLVKANAYGHDALLISAYTQKENLCDAFGVASIEEGIILRQNGITLPILVLGSIYPFDCFEYALKNNLSVTVASVRAAAYITQLAEKLKILEIVIWKHWKKSFLINFLFQLLHTDWSFLDYVLSVKKIRATNEQDVH